MREYAASFDGIRSLDQTASHTGENQWNLNLPFHVRTCSRARQRSATSSAWTIHVGVINPFTKELAYKHHVGPGGECRHSSSSSTWNRSWWQYKARIGKVIQSDISFQQFFFCFSVVLWLPRSLNPPDRNTCFKACFTSHTSHCSTHVIVMEVVMVENQRERFRQALELSRVSFVETGLPPSLEGRIASLACLVAPW